MAITYVGKVGSSSSASGGASSTITVGAGGVAQNDRIIVTALVGNGTATPSVPTDSGGNTYVLDKSTSVNTDSMWVWSANASTALVNGNTIVVNLPSGNTEFIVIIEEYSGIATSGYGDGTNGTGLTSGVNNNANSGNVTTTNANDLLFGAVGAFTDGTSVTWLNSFGQRDTVAIGTAPNADSLFVADNIVSATGTYAAAATVSNNPEWLAILTTYQAAGSVLSVAPLSFIHPISAGRPLLRAATVAVDTFLGRTVGTDWGTASDGNVWTKQRAGTNQTASVGSDEGQDITSSGSGNTASRFTLGTVQPTDVEILLRWATQNAGDNLGIFVRWQDTQNWYHYGFDSGGPILELSKSVANTFSTFQTVSIAGTWVAGTFYWFRLKVVGNRHQLRWWQDGTQEPTTWNLDSTDSSFLTGGLTGISVRALDTTTPVKVDRFSVNDIGAVWLGTGVVNPRQRPGVMPYLASIQQPVPPVLPWFVPTIDLQKPLMKRLRPWNAAIQAATAVAPDIVAVLRAFRAATRWRQPWPHARSRDVSWIVTAAPVNPDPSGALQRPRNSLRAWRWLRRGKIIVPSTALDQPIPPLSRPQRMRPWPRNFRWRRAFDIPWFQAAPNAWQTVSTWVVAARSRFWRISRRGRIVMPGLGQAPDNPWQTMAGFSFRKVFRRYAWRRARMHDEAVLMPQQQAVPNPPIVEFLRTIRKRLPVPRRGRRFEPGWGQAVIQTPAFVDWWRRARTMRVAGLRRRRRDPIGEAGTPPPPTRRRQQVIPRRSRVGALPFQVVAVVIPPFREGWRRLRNWRWPSRKRSRSDWIFPPGVAAPIRDISVVIGALFGSWISKAVQQRWAMLVAVASSWVIRAPAQRIGQAFDIPAGGKSLYASIILADRPLAYWRLNDQGLAVLDLAGSYNGTLHGNVTEGVAGGLTDGDTAMRFDIPLGNGQQGNIVLPSIPANLNIKAMAFEAWVNLTLDTRPLITTGTYEQVATRFAPVWSPGLILYNIVGRFPNVGFSIAYSGGNNWIVSVWLGGSAGASYSGTYGSWHHVAATYAGFGSSFRTTYIDGVAVATESDGTTADFTDTFRIGEEERWNGYDTVPLGTLDEIAIYDYALSAAQVLDHYTQGIQVMSRWVEPGNENSAWTEPPARVEDNQ